MNLSSFVPQDQVFWYINKNDVTPLTHNITTDVVVIGGGMAGISAAQSFLKKGCKVVLVEKNFCGSGASGKSSGFITPDSELSLDHFIALYGPNEAQKIWEFALAGIQLIKSTIEKNTIECDYQVQDTLVLANTHHAFKNDISREHEARKRLNYTSTLYDSNHITDIIGSHDYQGGVVYGDTFGIHAYRYCQAVKHILRDSGVHVYEETPVIDIQNNRVSTPQATIKAEHIIVAVDRFAQALNIFPDVLFQAQTFLMMSAPLSQSEVKKIFPDKPLMVWDSDLLYQYFRLTGDNRLMLGGASLLDTYVYKEKHNNLRMAKNLISYMHKKFPGVSLQFDYIWPGLVGVSKDLFPIAGTVPHMPSVYCISAAAGLPWAAGMGIYSADHIIDKKTGFDAYLSPQRSFTLGRKTQFLLRKPLTFALSHFLTIGM